MLDLNNLSLPILTNLSTPGMLFASTIRAPADRGINPRIEKRNLPQGYVYLNPNDPGFPFDTLQIDGNIPIFAKKSFSYKGEALGLIIGPEQGICDEIASGSTVEYEEEDPELEWESFSSSQIVCKHSIQHGDPDAAFRSGLQIERAVYRNGAFDHQYSEPMGALADWDYDKMAIYCASQWPSHVKRSVAACLGVSETDISVNPTNLGRSFDGRLWFPSIIACQAAIAARLLCKPVRILYTREEDYLYTSKQAKSTVTITSGTDINGKIEALDVRIILNIGAYNPLAEELLLQAEAMIPGMYSCPAIRIKSYAIKTNTIPLGAMGGIGASHASFSIEAHMNRLALIHQKTPAELKAINMVSKRNSYPGQTVPIYEIPFLKLHAKLESISDYKRKYASYELVKKRNPGLREDIIRGIALTVGYQTSRSFSSYPGMNSYQIEATLTRDLTLVFSGQAVIGSDTLRNMWRDIASSILSIPKGSIHFSMPDSNSNSFNGPLTLSRGSSVITRLIERSCRAIQKKRFRDSLPISAKVQTRNPPRSSLSEATRAKPSLSETPSWCGTAVEIEIDALSGEPRSTAVWMVIDAGRIIDLPTTRSSLRSSVLRALQMCTGSASPDSAIEIEFLDPDRNIVPRGLGELPFITIPAAFYSALTQAIGNEPRQLPLSGSEILELVEKA
jgi:CO/xanthine dehydrogenase Mo-binding subunit